MGRLYQRVLGLGRSLAIVVGWVVIVALAEQIPILQDLEAFFDAREGLSRLLQTVTLGMAISGAILLAGAQFLPAPRRTAIRSGGEREPRDPEMEYEESKSGWSRAFSAEVSFREVKRAWRSRSWRSSRQWRIFFVMMTGALLLAVGLFGFVVVAGPPAIKLLFGGAFLYAVGRIGWSFWRA